MTDLESPIGDDDASGDAKTVKRPKRDTALAELRDLAAQITVTRARLAADHELQGPYFKLAAIVGEIEAAVSAPAPDGESA